MSKPVPHDHVDYYDCLLTYPTTVCFPQRLPNEAKLQVKIQKLSTRSIEFDLVGVDASIANALRRILIAEVPTVAIEYVYVWNNTSVMMKSSLNGQATDRNTIIFKLQIEDCTDPAVLYHNSEADVFSACPLAPTILETRLRQAAFSPVEKRESGAATASYRLLPHVNLDEANPVPPHLATRFRDCFSPGVIKRGVHGETMSCEVLRHPDLAKYVKLARVRDHFIFNIESEGPYEPQRLPLEAIRVMREKISTLKSAAEALRAQRDPDGDIQMADA
ncbi:DNA-directed RNA polymerase [Lactifluus subvellereus]|nr:DNA-directed RNA polymerase [Lactifluus subvellereus]